MRLFSDKEFSSARGCWEIIFCGRWKRALKRPIKYDPCSETTEFSYDLRDLKSLSLIALDLLLFFDEQYKTVKYCTRFCALTRFDFDNGNSNYHLVYWVMKQYYVDETWQIFEMSDVIRLYCSCQVHFRDCGLSELDNAILWYNGGIYREPHLHCDTSIVCVFWYIHALRENEDFLRFCSHSESEDMLVYMLSEQLQDYYNNFNSIGGNSRYSNFFDLYKKLISRLYFSKFCNEL